MQGFTVIQAFLELAKYFQVAWEFWIPPLRLLRSQMCATAQFIFLIRSLPLDHG